MRSWFSDRRTVVTCVPCQRRQRSLGGHPAKLQYLVEGRAGADGGHLVYQQHGNPDMTVLLCMARNRGITERAGEALQFPVVMDLTWHVFRENDGAEIDSDANPAGSWLVNRYETAEGPRWAIQRPWDDECADREYLTEIEAIADAVAGMVVSALSHDEQG